MSYNLVLLLSAVAFVVTLKFNLLFLPLSSLFSKKHELGMILKHFLVKERFTSEKACAFASMSAPRSPGPFALFAPWVFLL